MPFGPYTTNLELTTAILLGIAWSTDSEFILASAQTYNVAFTTGNNKIALNGANISSNSVKTEISFYEDSIYTPDTGVDIATINRNRNNKSDPLPVDGPEENPTITDQGTSIIHTIAYGVSGQGSKGSIYSSIGSETALVLEPNTSYILEITNLDTTTSNYELHMIFSLLR